jgi:hypothetical protein
MSSRGTALIEFVIGLPLLLLLGGAICYFGYCSIVNAQLNILAWEGASQMARGKSLDSWKATLADRGLPLEPERLTAELQNGTLRLSYLLPKPFWVKAETGRRTSFSWQRPQRK